MSTPIIEDLKYIYKNLGNIKKFKNKNILITGCGGLIGFYLILFLKKYKKKLGIKKIIGVDNIQYKSSDWIGQIYNQKDIIFYKKNINNINYKDKKLRDIDFIFHMASVASPYYFNKDPINVFDTNCIAYKKILDFYKSKKGISILYFSTSEFYGTPDKKNIPTKENYLGQINTIGPRACYDESKRAGETLSYIYYNQFKMNIKIVRLFNTYGPGQSFNDRRAVSDFARNIFFSKNINVYSSKKYTRSFCYVSDTIIGIIKAQLYNKFDVFNLGNSSEEISIYELAKAFKIVAKKVLNKNIKINLKTHKRNLKDVPVRRCPNIEKAKLVLNYKPKIQLIDGLTRYVNHLKFTNLKKLNLLI